MGDIEKALPNLDAGQPDLDAGQRDIEKGSGTSKKGSPVAEIALRPWAASRGGSSAQFKIAWPRCFVSDSRRAQRAR
jgi:hypothetical protein